jgi:hypothetical protein
VAAKRSKLVKKRTVVDEHGLEVQTDTTANFINKEQAIHTHTVGEEGDLHENEKKEITCTKVHLGRGRNYKAMWSKALDINNLRKLKKAQ